MSENYYNILGVDEKATKDEIKKAFRTLSFKYHPDKNGGSQESTVKFQQINEAYETLGNEQKREQYDMQRNNPFVRMNSNGGGGMDGGVNMNDFFNVFFGGGGMPPNFPGMPRGMPSFQGMPGGPRIHIFHGGPMNFEGGFQKPTPIIKNIVISMEQVFTGTNLPLEIERWVVENETKTVEKETIYIDIPKGVDDGEIMVLRDKGNVVNENTKGDIKIFIKIENNSIFKRAGLDLILEKDISLKEALCGFSFEINYLNGKSYTLNNNKGNIIQPNYKKIYQNMGLVRGNHTGNMIINFNIKFPEKLDNEQIENLEKIL